MPLTVGNGDFGCTVDITGMQTFTAFHEPFLAGDRLVTNTCTQTTWGWHEMPNPEGYTIDDAVTAYPTARGEVDYADTFDMMAMFGLEADPDKVAGTWLFANPQRLDLGRTGLVLRSSLDAEPETDPSVLTDVEQRLDLWTGTIHELLRVPRRSRCRSRPPPIPERSQVAFRIESPLLHRRPPRRPTGLPVRPRRFHGHGRLGRRRPPHDRGRGARRRRP